MLPALDNPIWRKLVLDEVQHDFRFFALKILMGRLKMRLEFDKGDNVIEECVNELYAFACQYPDFVAKDLARVRS